MDSCLRGRGNLCAVTRDQRVRAGVVLFGLALFGAVMLAKAGLSPWFRVALVVPFWFSAQSFDAALRGTCGFMASRGLRHTQAGAEPIIDRQELADVQIAGRRQVVEGTIATFALTALVVLAG